MILQGKQFILWDRKQDKAAGTIVDRKGEKVTYMPKSMKLLDEEQLPYFTDSIGIVFREDIFSWDLMQTVQRTIRTHGKTEIRKITRHRTVLMSPVHAKILFDYLRRQIEAYEQRYGTIEIPQPPILEKEEKGKEKKGIRTMNTVDIIGYHG